MSDDYNVIFNGKLKEGFELPRVLNDFAKIFKIDNEKAERYFSGSAHIIRKKVDQVTANKFKNALEKIGAIAELHKLESQPLLNLDSLSLVPMTGENNHQETPKVEEIIQSVVKNGIAFSCPKCATEQEKQMECISCGIIFDKYFARKNNESANSNNQSILPTNDREASPRLDDNEKEVAANDLPKNALLAAVAAAIVGAFIWKFIAVVFDYELGLIAWGIGGAIGYAAAKFGSFGQKAGIICGILALFSIFGGKYMAYNTFIEEFNLANDLSVVEQREVYDDERAEAELYAKTVTDNKSKRQFIADNGYSESIGAKEVTIDEINYFDEYVLPIFNEINNNTQNFDLWVKNTFQEQENYTAMDLMQDSFGIIDLIFLFLGIGTAFRLGSNQE